LGVLIRHFFIFLVLITAFPAVGNALIPFCQTKPDTNQAKSDDNLIKSKIHYTAKDSIRLDLNNQKVYLYGDAVVEYESTTMKAAYLEVDFKTHIVHARGQMDSAGHMIGKPLVKEADKSFSAREMYYNTETKKGKIYEITTQEGDGKVLGEAVKKDSTNVYFIMDGRYSTCSLDEPHFDIHAHKLKVIANDKIITGPANLQVMGINTPLALPFGFFPNKRGRASGILIPMYGESQAQGFFLRGGGYYFGISDHVDLALKGDIYSRGSYGLNAISSYKVRYEYYGNVNLSFAHNLIENATTKIDQNNFRVAWIHSQDSKSNPSSNFSANVNVVTSNYLTYNAYTPAAYLSNTMQSNISWRKVFIGTPFNLSANLRHSQNTIQRTVDLSLPDLALTMNRINPFKQADAIGEHWYDKIGVSASLEGKNDISTGDSILFKSQSIKRFQNGLHTNIPISASLRSHLKTNSRIINGLNFISLTPSIVLNDNLYSSITREQYIPRTPTDSAKVKTDTLPIVKNAFDYSLNLAMTTKLYGTYSYRHGRIKVIHHVITPNITLVYRPDFGESKYGYYKNVQTTPYGTFQNYSIFQNGIFGGPGAGLQKAVNMSLANNLEAKLRPKGDTATIDRKVSLLDLFNISTGYNAAAAHFRWSQIALSAQTALFKRKLNISALTTLDPYLMGADGSDIEKFEINHNDRIGRLTNASLSMGTSFHSKDNGAGKPKTSSKGSPEELEHINTNPNAYVDFNMRWSLNVNYVLGYSKQGQPDMTSVDLTGFAQKAIVKDIVTQTLRFNGDCNVTAKWKVGFDSGYDFVHQSFSYTNIKVYRDLHCWDMAFNWIPFGRMQSYSVDLKVKSAVLQDLKLSKRREWTDYTN
jgi:hypothetical protein